MNDILLGLCWLLCLSWLISLIGYRTWPQRLLLGIAILLLSILIYLVSLVLL